MDQQQQAELGRREYERYVFERFRTGVRVLEAWLERGPENVPGITRAEMADSCENLAEELKRAAAALRAIGNGPRDAPGAP